MWNKIFLMAIMSLKLNERIMVNMNINEKMSPLDVAENTESFYTKEEILKVQAMTGTESMLGGSSSWCIDDWR